MQTDALEDFITRVDVAWNGCWLWTGSIDHRGYGRWFTKAPGYSQGAHRAAWELLVGPIPDGLVIDHLCRITSCVNPDHLEPVTNAENIRRGYGFTAQHGRKTHCIHGHRLTVENTYQGQRAHYGRVCRICVRNRVAASAARRKLQAAR